VVRLDPKREAAWKRLGFKRHNGHWMTAAQIREQAEQKKADQEWGKRLKELHEGVHGRKKDPEAAGALVTIQDPRAVPAVFREFGSGKASDQKIAIQILGQIRTRASSRALAALAVFGASDAVRRAATESLRSRDPLEYLGGMIALLADPIHYEVRPVGGPGSPGVLWIEGEQFDTRRLYAPPPVPNVTPQWGDFVTYDAFGMPVITRPNPVPLGFASTPITPAQVQPNPALVASLSRAGVPNAQALLASAQPVLPTPSTAGLAPDSIILGVNYTQETTGYLAQQFSLRQALIESRKAAISAQAQLDEDIKAIDRVNAARKEFSDRVLGTVKDATGKDLGSRPKNWRDWLVRQTGSRQMNVRPKATIDELVELVYQPVMFSLPTIVTQSSIKATLLVKDT
jgi:hypothetical protein